MRITRLNGKNVVTIGANFSYEIIVRLHKDSLLLLDGGVATKVKFLTCNEDDHFTISMIFKVSKKGHTLYHIINDGKANRLKKVDFDK